MEEGRSLIGCEGGSAQLWGWVARAILGVKGEWGVVWERTFPELVGRGILAVEVGGGHQTCTFIVLLAKSKV